MGPLRVEMEITLRCNEMCPSCNRHCGIIDPGPSDMTMEQVKRFTKEVRSVGGIDLVSIMGGEPTLHRQFTDIVLMLHELLLDGKLRTLQVATNGRRDLVDCGVPVDVLADLKVYEVHPVDKVMRCSFLAPVDIGQETRECSVPVACGICLNKFGWSPCGPGAAIARLFRFGEFIRADMPLSPEEFSYYRQKLCTRCQLFAREYKYEPHTYSKSYVAAIVGYLARGGRKTPGLNDMMVLRQRLGDDAP